MTHKFQNTSCSQCGGSFGPGDNLFEILQAIDHTLTVHGHIDSGTPLHQRIINALSSPNEDPSGQRREPMRSHPLDDKKPFPISSYPKKACLSG